MSSNNDFIQIYPNEMLYLPFVLRLFRSNYQILTLVWIEVSCLKYAKLYPLKIEYELEKSNIKSFIEAIKSLLLTLPPCLMLTINQIPIAGF